MWDVPVFYATTEGQTRRIAERLAADLKAMGLSSAAIHMTSPAADDVDWTRVRAVVVGASIHGSKHQKAAARFIARNAAHLNAIPSAFVSVSMSAASADPKIVGAAEQLARDFVAERRWTPTRVYCVAGRLAFTEYGWLKRRIMRMISEKMGGPTDVSRDHEFTNWRQVEQIASDIARRVSPRPHCALAG